MFWTQFRIIGLSTKSMERETFGFLNQEPSLEDEVYRRKTFSSRFKMFIECLGIVVYDRLDDILKLCSSSLISDRKFVVQKYIERPLLIHNTKFDIRQWFLVTDLNPLTIWMYKDCYFRFCTEHFSLSTRQQNVHLCNYSIQKHYKNNANRSEQLPGSNSKRTNFSTKTVWFWTFSAENMWKSDEFIEKYLKPRNLEDKWESLIYPSMKDAILCSMFVAQDSIDPRRVKTERGKSFLCEPFRFCF